jgi:Domain of unknown function (DUF1992)
LLAFTILDPVDQEPPTSHETGSEGTAAGDLAPDEGPRQTDDQRRAAAKARIAHQDRWVELQIKSAMERGAFDDLPGLGKPLANLGSAHDPDWWLKQFVERENVTGVLPPALQLRRDDELLDSVLDSLSAEAEVRREVKDFNERVKAAFYQPLGGPPLITKERDVDAEVAAWRERRSRPR